MITTRKRSKKVWRPSVLITNLINLIGICFMAWFAISMIQCWMHQADYLVNGTHYTYPNWNMFIFMSKLFY